MIISYLYFIFGRIFISYHRAGLFMGPYFVQCVSAWPMRSSREEMLQVPSAKQCCLVGSSSCAFSGASLAVWNNIPTKIWMDLTLLAFLKTLKIWLFPQGFGSNVLLLEWHLYYWKMSFTRNSIDYCFNCWVLILFTAQSHCYEMGSHKLFLYLLMYILHWNAIKHKSVKGETIVLEEFSTF